MGKPNGQPPATSADASAVKPGRGFDPLRDLFVAQSEKPAGIGEINLRALTPYQRALLVIDGTLTKFIEAYTLEPVQVIHLDQAVRELTSHHLWLDAPAGTQVIARQVLLWARYSDQMRAFAVSLIVPERLGTSVQEAVETGGEGLGRILLQNELETRREVLWYGLESNNELPARLRERTRGDLISRTYRIFCQNLPIMLINEKFPLEDTPEPAHY
jgi:chorismate-pyruvate lyase